MLMMMMMMIDDLCNCTSRFVHCMTLKQSRTTNWRSLREN